MGRALVNVPKKAARGEVIEIKALIAHPMETGYRHELNGPAIARDILHHFACTYNGEVVFEAELYPAVAANPFFAFTTIATQSGVLAFSWTDDGGNTQVELARIVVE